MTDEEVREQRITRNEQIKGLSSITAQLGAALFAAAIVQMYTDKGPSFPPIIWIGAAGLIIWLSMRFLRYLKAED